MDGGRLRLALRHDDAGRVIRAELRSHRPVTVCRVLVGKPVDKAVALVPLLFALCGRAQGAAAQAAVAAARGEGDVPDRARWAVLAEAVQEWLYPPLIGWSALSGMSETALMVQIRESTRAVMQNPDPINCEMLAAAVDALVSVDSDGQLVGPVASLWQRLCDLPFHEAPTRLLPVFAAADLLVAWPDQAEFCALPHWHGQAVEVGPLADYQHEPVVQEALHARGHGPLARFAARLCALRQAVQVLQGQAPLPLVSAVRCGDGCGLAVVQAARGPLAHRVTIGDDGLVADWQILAPTEWNFHPASPWVAALAGLSLPEAGQVAHWQAATLDPCVPCDVVPVAAKLNAAL